MKRLMGLAGMAVLLVAAAPADLLNAPGRPDAMVALDAGRKPAEVLAQSLIKPGARVMDVMAGQGYYTELLARHVGPKGRVIAIEPVNYMEDSKTAEAWAALQKRNRNVDLVVGAPGEAAMPDKLDAAFYHLTYHDLYWQSEKFKYPRTNVDAYNARLFQALKPGGVVLIIDHYGVRGMDSRAQADKTHRIDADVVKANMVRAGFRFAGSVPILEVTGDDPAKLVFDPSLRGKTNRFYYRFVKP
ncbi:methyltransferase domain-containing protein [Sandarakinorhabdus limnophila]|uniref:methyltransferase domain-containing protein n=1 Tax=Sandarakinorhabdus limnophila TaxID=210512 RepID=UPI0026F07AEE|nr:methyltransferase domain-containing protein [Sandarakinorhabdus limnophila]